MSDGTKYAFTMEIENLGAGNVVTIELDAGSTWTLQFQLRSEAWDTPLSLNSLSLSDSELSITAGALPLSAALIVNVMAPSVMTGRTSSNDPGCHVRAQVSAGKTTDLMGDWAVSFR